MIINMMIISMMIIIMMIINMMILNIASFRMVSSIGGLAATSWVASLSSEFDDFASTQIFRVS